MVNRRFRTLSSVKVHRAARLGRGCVLGDNVRIGADVVIGDMVQISSNTIIQGPARIGDRSYIGPSCILGHPLRQELRQTSEGHGLRRSQDHILDIGADCTIRSGCVLYCKVTVGDGVETGHNVLIREESSIGSGSMIGTNSVIDGYSKIGENVRIQTGVYVSPFSTIKERVFLGPCCILLNDKYAMQKEVRLQGPVIESGASIGGGAVIMPAVKVGEGAVVGAGSVVVKDVPSRTICVGVPARTLKKVPGEWMIRLDRG